MLYSAFAVAIASTLAIPSAGAIAVGFAVASVYGATVSISATGIFAIVFAVVYGFAYSFVTPIVTGVIAEFTGAFANTIAIAIAIAVTVTITNYVTIFMAWLLDRTSRNGRRLAVWLGFTLAMLAVLAGAAVWALPAVDKFERDTAATLLVFLVLLPLLNVVWDWLSLGLSRGLLSGIRLDLHRGWTQLMWALADIAFGFLFLLGLVVMTTAAVATMNLLYHWGGGAVLLIDLPQYFGNLRAAPDHPSFWWLYFMYLSTLIPTVLHLLIAGAASIQWLAAHWLGVGAWREHMANSMATHSVNRLYGQIYLTIVPMVGLVVPLGMLWLIYWGLTTHGGVVGFALLDWAEWIARFVMGDLFPAQMPAPDPYLMNEAPVAP